MEAVDIKEKTHLNRSEFNQLFDTHMASLNKIWQYFHCPEAVVDIPITDGRRYHWLLTPTALRLKIANEEWFDYPLADRTLLPKAFYQTADFGLVCVQSRTPAGHLLILVDMCKATHPAEIV